MHRSIKPEMATGPKTPGGKSREKQWVEIVFATV
jgi:hypothetical protein